MAKIEVFPHIKNDTNGVDNTSAQKQRESECVEMTHKWLNRTNDHPSHQSIQG